MSHSTLLRVTSAPMERFLSPLLRDCDRPLRLPSGVHMEAASLAQRLPKPAQLLYYRLLSRLQRLLRSSPPHLLRRLQDG